MVDRSKRPRLSALPRADERDYEVGYAKPPVHTQFKPGRSGNPVGRPRGAKNKGNRIPALNEERMKKVVMEEAYRMIGVRDSERLVEIPVIQAVIRSVALNAAKGQQRSQRMFIDLLQWVERENKAMHDEWLQTLIEYKVDSEREMERRERTGETGPEPLPHPDHVVIDFNTGRAEIRGPMTKEQKIHWDRLHQMKPQIDEEIAELETSIEENPDDSSLKDKLERELRLRARITRIIGD